MDRPGFTEAVRQELARHPPGGDARVRAELGAIVLLAGLLRMRGGDEGGAELEVLTTSGPVARRTFTLLVRRYGLRPEIQVRSPSGLRRRLDFRLRLGSEAPRVGRDLGVVDAAGWPSGRLPTARSASAAVAQLRGALLACGTVSAPGHAPHLELSTRSVELAEQLAGLVERVVGAHAGVTGGDRPRAVLKSGERIGELLTALGATRAFLELDDQRLRRQLRGEANRLANADRANLRRSIEASAGQLEMVERVIAEVGWEALDDELRDVALARLANPEASLGELGGLLDPPVSKAATHRRLRRLAALGGARPPQVEQDTAPERG